MASKKSKPTTAPHYSATQEPYPQRMIALATIETDEENHRIKTKAAEEEFRGLRASLARDVAEYEKLVDAKGDLKQIKKAVGEPACVWENEEEDGDSMMPYWEALSLTHNHVTAQAMQIKAVEAHLEKIGQTAGSC